MRQDLNPIRLATAVTANPQDVRPMDKRPIHIGGGSSD